MNILGLGGGTDTIFKQDLNIPMTSLSHDSSAALIMDGELVSACEEERFNRIKHTNLFPTFSIEWILRKNNLTLDDIDIIAVYVDEWFLDAGLLRMQVERNSIKLKLKARDLIFDELSKLYNGKNIEKIKNKIKFYSHHLCHAYAALPYSNSPSSLVFVSDAMGESTSGLIGEYRDNSFKILKHLAPNNSIGVFYSIITNYIGFKCHDEYKVMGLSPYGSAEKYSPLLQSCFKFTDDGIFEFISPAETYTLLMQASPPRVNSEPLLEVHKDLAAALQQSLEFMSLKILSYWKEKTGLDSLVLSGGVAQNSSNNGKIIQSDLFDDVFVSPVSSDLGCSLGAAQLAYASAGENLKIQKFLPYCGPDIESTESSLEEEIYKWASVVNIVKSDSIEEDAAKIIADGGVLSWVQGCLEYGPRALGNRSILADPRPPENKNRINKVVKNREGFRPFAPAILDEFAEKYFEIPKCTTCYDYMTYVLNVQVDHREYLGAVTHVDGSARIQTVKKSLNPKFYKLIQKFYDLTDCPIVLNTSYNNHAEPIVSSVSDAIACFLTCKLDALVIGDYLFTKDKDISQDISNLKAVIPSYMGLIYFREEASEGNMLDNYQMHNRITKKYKCISPELFKLLKESPIEGTKIPTDNPGLTQKLSNELYDLWFDRMISMEPFSLAVEYG